MYIDLDNAISKFKTYIKQFDTKDKAKVAQGVP